MRRCLLLARVLPWVGHPPTRNRGTVGGSIANADPSAEIPLVAVTLGAEIEMAKPDGPSSMPADEFFIGPMLTAVDAGRLRERGALSGVGASSIGTGFHEVSARQSDFAFVAAAAQVALDDDGRCIDVALGLGGVGDRAIRIDVSALIGSKARRGIRRGRRSCRRERHGCIELDLHASADYRRRVAVTLGKRALERCNRRGQRPRR